MLPVLLVEILAILDISLVNFAREVAEHLHEERYSHQLVVLINILGSTNAGCYHTGKTIVFEKDPVHGGKLKVCETSFMRSYFIIETNGAVKFMKLIM
mgnify:CR=1 FL=1